jgi:hypothetical protein
VAPVAVRRGAVVDDDDDDDDDEGVVSESRPPGGGAVSAARTGGDRGAVSAARSGSVGGDRGAVSAARSGSVGGDRGAASESRMVGSKSQGGNARGGTDKRVRRDTFDVDEVRTKFRTSIPLLAPGIFCVTMAKFIQAVKEDIATSVAETGKKSTAVNRKTLFKRAFEHVHTMRFASPRVPTKDSSWKKVWECCRIAKEESQTSSDWMNDADVNNVLDAVCGDDRIMQFKPV